MKKVYFCGALQKRGAIPYGGGEAETREPSHC